ncbi:MAG: hypothetical protein JSW52_04955 [Candidatus Coatesbacteria bacterium]|nr:MAG: hypothetical protein JSW52_04955 [Candidatus Coatesbacteria bacterium]
MKRNSLLATAVLLAAGVVLFVGCDGVTGPGDEYGTAELIYELSDGVVPTPRLGDVSSDGKTYLIRGYDYETEEHQIWIVNRADDVPELIISGTGYVLGDPKLSPDKKNVAYINWDGIYVIPVSGDEPRCIYNKGIGPRPYHWVDNETVLIVSLEDGWYVKTVNINTLAVDTLTKVENISSLEAAYLSPNGKLIACSADYSDLGPPGSNAFTDAFNLARLKELIGFDDPERRRSSFVLSLDRSFRSNVVTVETRAVAVKEKPGASGNPAIDKFFSGLSDYWSKTTSYLFRIYEPYTGKYKELEPGGICDGWSPDGKKIKYVGGEIWYFDLVKEEYILVFRSNKLEFDVFGSGWTPDGKGIIAAEKRTYGGNLRVYLVTVD